MYSRSALESSRSTPGRSPLPATVGSRTGSCEPAACRRARRSRRASSMTAVSVLPDRCASSFASASTSSSRLMVVRTHQIIQACHQYAYAGLDCASPRVAQTPLHPNCGAVVCHLTTGRDSVLRTFSVTQSSHQSHASAPISHPRGGELDCLRPISERSRTVGNGRQSRRSAGRMSFRRPGNQRGHHVRRADRWRRSSRATSGGRNSPTRPARDQAFGAR